MVKNIMYREAGEDSRIRHFELSKEQKTVIKKVVGLKEKGSSTDSDDDSAGSGSDKKKKPKLTYPYIKLELVPTRADMFNKKKKWNIFWWSSGLSAITL